MAIPADCTLMTIGGAMPGGDVWQCGLWGVGNTPADNDEANALAQIWFSECCSTDDSGAFREFLSLFNPNQITIQTARVYAYTTSGTVANFIGEYEGNPIFGTGSQTMPNQITAALTLRTGYAGRQNRGRIYLPALKGVLDTAGELNQANINTAMDSFKLFMDDWNAASVPTLSVVSRTGSHSHPITSISMDTRPDIQRRRANKQLIEARISRVLQEV